MKQDVVKDSNNEFNLREIEFQTKLIKDLYKQKMKRKLRLISEGNPIDKQGFKKQSVILEA